MSPHLHPPIFLSVASEITARVAGGGHASKDIHNWCHYRLRPKGVLAPTKKQKLLNVTLISRAKAISDHFKGQKYPAVNKL